MIVVRVTIASAIAAAMAAPAYAQAAAGAAGTGPNQLISFAIMIGGMGVMFYFMILRPQQQRQKQHQAMIMGVKRGDTVVLSSGVIGKVMRVEEAELGVEISTGVTIKVVKAMVSDVRVKGQPAPANDQKS